MDLLACIPATNILTYRQRLRAYIDIVNELADRASQALTFHVPLISAIFSPRKRENSRSNPVP
jgi:hypothetical protein